MLLVTAALGLSHGCKGTNEGAGVAPVQGPALARGRTLVVTAAELEGEGGAGARRDLDAAIARRVAAAEARRRGLEAAPDVRARVETLQREAARREEAVLRDALYEALRDELVLADEELRAHYEKTRVRYTEHRYRLRKLGFASAAEARAVDAALGEQGRLDPAVATELDPAPAAALPRDLVPEALRLHAPGQRIVAVRDGGATLVELVEILRAEPRAFEAARDEVEKSLRTIRAQQAFRAEIARLRAEAGVVVDEAALAALERERAQQRNAPAVPSPRRTLETPRSTDPDAVLALEAVSQ